MDIRVILQNASGQISYTLKNGFTAHGEEQVLAKALAMSPDTTWAMGDADILPAGTDGDMEEPHLYDLLADIRRWNGWK